MSGYAIGSNLVRALTLLMAVADGMHQDAPDDEIEYMRTAVNEVQRNANEIGRTKDSVDIVLRACARAHEDMMYVEDGRMSGDGGTFATNPDALALHETVARDFIRAIDVAVPGDGVRAIVTNGRMG